MSLFLDSALPEEARQAFRTGLVKGITTNPNLITKTNRPAQDIIRELCDISTGIVFHQLTASDLSSRRDEAIKIASLRPGKIGLKIPCTFENLRLAAELTADGYIIGITAIFSPEQVYLACQSGAQYILPYVNRSTRLLGDGIKLVSRMRAVIDAGQANTQIIAASIKSPEEAIDTLLAGAHHLTLPLNLIEVMGDHPLSQQTIREFEAQG